MADVRTFAKLDLGYFDNPKLADFVEDRPRIPILHLRAILYCRQHLTNGRFPIRAVVRLAYASHCGSHCDGQCDFCAAAQCGLFERIDDRTAMVHDYLEHQDSAEQALKRKAAGQKAAAARWGSSSDAKGNADGIANRNADGNAEKRREEKRRDTAASGEEFDLFWAKYPRKIGKGQAVKAWRAATKKADAPTILGGLDAHLPIWAHTEEKFIPHASTWLNGERWEDAPAAAAADDEPRYLTPAEIQARRGF